MYIRVASNVKHRVWYSNTSMALDYVSTAEKSGYKNDMQLGFNSFILLHSYVYNESLPFEIALLGHF
jgi:hypothetical protein